MSEEGPVVWGPRQEQELPPMPESTRRRRLLMRVVLAATILVAVVRVGMTYDRAAFVHAWGVANHLDMNTFIGQQIAERETPGSWDSALFSLLCVLLLLIAVLPRVAKGAPWARNTALVLAGLGGLNSLGSLAEPAPVWYHLATIVMVVLTGVVIVLIWRMPVLEDWQLRQDITATRRQQPRG